MEFIDSIDYRKTVFGKFCKGYCHSINSYYIKKLKNDLLILFFPNYSANLLLPFTLLSNGHPLSIRNYCASDYHSNEELLCVGKTKNAKAAQNHN